MASREGILVAIHMANPTATSTAFLNAAPSSNAAATCSATCGLTSGIPPGATGEACCGVFFRDVSGPVYGAVCATIGAAKAARAS